MSLIIGLTHISGKEEEHVINNNKINESNNDNRSLMFHPIQTHEPKQDFRD